MERSLQTDLSETEKREGLERVLSSSTFHRSDQLRSLLKYVCDCQIQGEGETLSEYTVAIGALGRPQDYSALEDGSVRNRIHTLRRRLEHYYEVENPGDPLVSGVYKLVVTVFLDSVFGSPGYDIMGFAEGPVIKMENPV